ncbi:MAG: FG-GAP repeat protein [Chloroflexi bacterium]|nr:FG-GAP repeat protein [Chloroflexota bacterium]
MRYAIRTIFIAVILWFIAIFIFVFDQPSARADHTRARSNFSPPIHRAPKANELRVCNSSGIYSQTIQAAIDAAQPGDIIKVAGGIYIESKPAVSANLYISKTVHLYGGYTCNDWATQNPALNISTIRPTTPDIAVVWVNGQFGQTALVAPTVDGFTITGGGGGNHGGGVRVTNSDAIINNNIITGNIGYLFGGGIWVQNGAPILSNNRVENNRVTPSGNAFGGGIQLESTRATISNNIIANNVVSASVGGGGGIAIQGGGPVVLTSNLIFSNTAAGLAGAATDSGYGGGIWAQGVTLTLTSNTIQQNTAHTFARGSSYLFGGGALIETTKGRLTGNLIQANRANRNTIFGNGGGIAAYTSTLTIQGGQVLNNSTSVNCEGYGGGIYFSNGALTLDATRIENNCAANTPFYGLGGGLAFINSPYTLTNAVIVNNYAFGNDTAVGGLSAGINSPGLVVNNTLANNRGQAIRVSSALTVTNNIILGHTTGISLTAAVPISATFNNFFNNTTDTRGFSLDSTNIVINPQLDANYRLNTGSPAIDAGTRTNAPDHDFDGEARAMIGTSGLYRIDIGADERTGTAQRVINLDTTTADLTIIGPGGYAPTPNGVNDWIGSSVMADDVNGDGRADLVTSAHDWAIDPDNAPRTTGQIFGLFNFGTRITGTIDLLTTAPALTVASQFNLQHIGSKIVGGDLNGDGKRDLIFGSSQDDNAGGGTVTPTVYALWGGSSLAGTRPLTDTSPANFTLRAPGQDFFAFSIINALATGDLNNNGVIDLVVGDALANDGGLAQAGAAFVIFGRSNLPAQWNLATTPADYTLYGPAINSHLGFVALGRVNNDSQIDLVARTDTDAYVILGALGGGVRHLSTTPADIKITGLQFGGVSVGDLTGDGQDDLILGSGATIFVIPGPLVSGQTYNASTAAMLKISGVPAVSFALGNVTGDAKLDLIIGAPTIRQAFVIPGGTSATGTLPIGDVAQVMIAGSVLTKLGADVAVGDLDFDGKLDLIVSTYGVDALTHPIKYQDAGTVYVFYGTGASGPLPPPSSFNQYHLPFAAK